MYVDDMKAPFKPKHRPGRTYTLCHMIADTDEELFAMVDKIGELFAMVDKIGVDRKWHQGDHFDIAKTKRDLAIAAGAIPISQRALAAMAMLRRRGEPMGGPEDAEARMTAFFRNRRSKPAEAEEEQ